MGKNVNVQKGKQGFQRTSKAPDAPTAAETSGAAAQPQRQDWKTGLSTEQIAAMYDKFDERQRRIVAQQDSPVDATNGLNAPLPPAPHHSYTPEERQAQYREHVRKAQEVYDALPEQDRVVLSDRQMSNVVGDMRGFVLLSGAQSREEESRVVTGILMRRELRRAEQAREPRRPAADIIQAMYGDA